MSDETSEERYRVDALAVRTPRGFESPPLSVNVGPSEVIAVVGPSGSGKTLIFEHLAGVFRPFVRVSGSASQATVGLGPQDPRLAVLSTDKVWTVLRLNPVLLGLERLVGARPSPSPHEVRAVELLERLQLDPRRILELPMVELSVSERKRVLLCAALLSHPEVLLLDGWNESLDASDRKSVAKLLELEQRKGLRILVSARTFPLRDLEVTRAIELGSEIEHGELEVPLLRKGESGPPHDYPLLELERLVVKRGSRRFGGQPRAIVVDGASLFVRHAEVLVLLGPAASGKTALLEAISGLSLPHRGVIRVANRDVTYARGRLRARQRRDVQLVFQDAASVLDGSRTVGSHLEEARSLTRKKGPSSSEWLEKLGLSPALLGARADQLSSSESQRVDLARSLILSPRLVLLDAPEVGGVDSDGGQMAALIQAEKRSGRAFLVATSQPETAAALADRVAVLHAGRVIELGAAAQVLTDPAHPVTRAIVTGSALPPSDPTTPPKGCAYEQTCERRDLPLCREKEPMLAPLRKPGEPEPARGARRVACFVPILGPDRDNPPERKLSAPAPPSWE